MGLQSAINGGISQAKFEKSIRDLAIAGGQADVAVDIASGIGGGPDAPAVSVGEEIAIHVSLPFHRRLGRRLFRLLRPFFLPLLTRFQARVTAGIEASPFVHRYSRALPELLSLREVVLRTEAQTAHAIHVLNHQSDALTKLSRMQAQLGAHRLAMEALAEDLLARQARYDEQLVKVRDEVMAFGTVIMADRAQQAESSDRQQVLLENVARKTREAAESGSVAAAWSGRLLRTRMVSLGSEILCRTSFGWLLLPAEDLRLVAAMAEQGDALEPGTSIVLQSLLEPGDTAIDVGANIGALTLVMAQTVGGTGCVMAFEPTPRCAGLLRRTAVLTGLQEVIQVVESAVGAYAGTNQLHLGLTSAHNSLLPLSESLETIEVSVQTLDDVLFGSIKPAVIKIDVEGAELDVMRGMQQLLGASPDLCVVVEFGTPHLDRTGSNPAEWLEAFTNQGFSPWRIDETDGSIQLAAAEDINGVFSVNLLMLRQPPAAWPRLRVKQ